MKYKCLIDPSFVNTVIKKRPSDIHKGDCGRILIAAGTREMAGAAVLSAKAALKSGSGLVKVCTSKEIFHVIQISVPEAICIDWSSTEDDLMQYDAIAAGPGMGVGKRTEEILERILTEYDKTVIVDADGLNVLSGSSRLMDMARTSKAQLIITPHEGEAARLLGKRCPLGMTKEEIGAALSEKLHAIVVVKGSNTLVSISEEEAYTNTTGNPGMATAGSGDVLTGIITSFAGQGLTPPDAAKAGVFVHGLSGDLAAEKLGEYGLTAGDIANCVPYAIKEVID